MKLTKVQRKDQDRIRAWIDKIQFKENSRSKAAIPDLSVEDVLEKFMPEYDINFSPIS